jgi:hypothetical protein
MLVWVKERWSDTVQSRGVYTGAFGARVGEERASQARSTAGRWKIGSGSACAWSRLAAMGRLKRAGTQVNGGRTEGKVRCRCCGDRNAAWMLECCSGELQARLRLYKFSRVKCVWPWCRRTGLARRTSGGCNAMRCLATEKQHSTDRQRRGMRCEARRRRGREAGRLAGRHRETRFQPCLPPVFENGKRTTKRTIPARLIAQYGELPIVLQSHPCPPIQPLAAAAAKTLSRPIRLAISRTISHECSLVCTKWANLVIIDRSKDATDAASPSPSKKKLRVFRHPKQRYNGSCSSSFLTTSFRCFDCATPAFLLIARRPTPVRRSSESTLQSRSSLGGCCAGVRAQSEMRCVIWLHRARDVLTCIVLVGTPQIRHARRYSFRVANNNDTTAASTLRCSASSRH